MVPYANKIIVYLWVGLGVIWLAGALTAKPAVRRQSASSRLLHGTLVVLAAMVGFSAYFRFGWLARPFVPASPVVVCLGLALVVAGIGCAVWARLFLGGNWSGTVTVKKDHTLIVRGPYAVARHPIYSGVLLAVLGTAVAKREFRGLVAIGLLVVALRMKSRIEEEFMTEEFGAAYNEYKRQVKALIPFVW